MTTENETVGPDGVHWSDPRQLQFAKNMAIAARRRGEDMMAINVHFLLALIAAAQNFVGSSDTRRDES